MQTRAGREEASERPGVNGRPFPTWRPQMTGNWRALAIGAGALVLGLGVLGAIWLLRRPLALLILGIVIAEALSPVVDRLAKRIPRLLAVALIYLALLLLFFGVLWYVTPRLLGQAEDAAAQIPYVLEDIQAWLAGHSVPAGESLRGTLSQQMAGMGPSLIRLPLRIFSSVLEFVVVLFISIYWLILAPRMWSFALSLVPEARHYRLREIGGDVGRAMGGYIRGTAIDGVILGLSVFIALSLIGEKYPLMLGLLTALLELVPILGATVSGILIVVVALTQSLRLAVIALLVALVIHQVENHILVPNIMHTQTDISPLLAVWAIFAGATVGGLIGAVIAIPLASAIQVLAVQVVVPAIRRRTGASAVDFRADE